MMLRWAEARNPAGIQSEARFTSSRILPRPISDGGLKPVMAVKRRIWRLEIDKPIPQLHTE